MLKKPRNYMSQDQMISVQKAYAYSLDAYEKGQLKTSIDILNEIIKAVPKFAPAHQLTGIIAFHTGKIDIAERAMAEAIRLQPENAPFLTNYVEVLRKAGKVDDAIKVGKRAVRLAPGNPNAHSNLGLAYYDAEDLIEAEASQKRALSFDPEFVAALNNLGSISRDNDDDVAAIKFYRAVLKAKPDYLETVNNLISILIETEALDDARELADDYLMRAPKSSELNRNRGRLYAMAADWDNAEKRFRDAIAFDETKADAYVGLAQVLYEKNHIDLALLEAEKAQRLDPEHASSYHYIAVCRAQLGDIEAGFANHNKALSLKPDFTASMIALGHLEMENGDFKAARMWFEQAATYERAHLSAHVSLARLDKITPQHPTLLALEAALPDLDTMVPEQAVALHYALGKCREDLKQNKAAFSHFKKGAAIKRGLVKFDPDELEQTTNDIIATFTPDFIEQMRSNAIDSHQPIFVVGMPRSGTTLTESILAAHPMVFGAGELSDLHALFSDRQNGRDNNTGSFIARFAPSELTNRITRYVEQVDARAPNSAHIVDKMPSNFQLVGLIHALLPNAKIIHIARNPFDTCLSCFTRVFERSQYHSYDQVELGRYFNAYVALMDHWKSTLPKGSFHTVHYENLVDDIETEARQMIAHCGLEWDNACLEFYKGERRVRTASFHQVRQPLYATSKEKWRKYETQLAPLIRTIGNTQIRF
jgi:tetratricopeptide (TPR) repeat protein